MAPGERGEGESVFVEEEKEEAWPPSFLTKTAEQMRMRPLFRPAWLTMCVVASGS